MAEENDIEAPRSAVERGFQNTAENLIPADFVSFATRAAQAPQPAPREEAAQVRSTQSDLIPADFISFAPAGQAAQAQTRASGQRSMFGDIATSFYSSMLDTLASGAAAGEYMAGSGGTLTRWRESLSAQAKEAQQNLSQEMQTGQSRRFIPSADEPEAPSAWSSFGDFFGAVGAQAVSSLGSIVASLPAIGVGILGGGPVGGMIAGGATTGLLGMGTVWKDTAEAFQAIPEEDRKRLNETYRRNRETMSEAEALDVTIREAAGRVPELVGVLSAIPGAIMGRFEAGLAARQLGGGVIRNAGRGAVTAGATEFPEEVVQNVGTQVATERLTGEAVSTADALEAGVRGAIGGGAMGSAMGAIGGAFQRSVPPVPTTETMPPPPSTTTQGVDPSLSSAVQQTETPPPPETPAAPRVDPSLAETVGWRDLVAQTTTSAVMSAMPDPLGVGGFNLISTPAPVAAEPTPEAPLEPTMGAVEQLTQSPIEALRAEGITLDEAETQRFGELDSDVEAYRKFLDCIRGLG